MPLIIGEIWMIKLEHITKQYRIGKKKEKIIALSDLSLSLEENTTYGIIGLNGSGKSTLLKTIAGIIVPEHGNVFFDNLNPIKNRKYVAEKMSIMFGQRTQLLWDLPLSDSFHTHKIIYKIQDDIYNDKIQYLVNTLSIAEYINQPVRTLSLGQRVKAELVLAFLRDSKYIFLDEPTIGLDVLVKKDIRQLINDYQKKYNVTVVITSHDLDDIEGICNNLILLDQGKIIYNSSLTSFVNEYSNHGHIVLKTNTIYNEDISKRIKQIDSVLQVTINKDTMDITYDKRYGNEKELLEQLLTIASFNNITITNDTLTNLIEKVYRV